MVKRKNAKIETLQPSPSSKSPRISLNFPQKLYSIVSSKNGPIKWYENTINTIEINLSALLNYLHDEESGTVNLWDFLRQLHWYGFKQLPSKTTDSIRFQNEYFIKGKREQLNKIRFHVNNDEDEMALVDAHKTKVLLNDHRRLTDKCRMKIIRPIDKYSIFNVKMKATAKMFQLDSELGKERAVIPRDLYKEPENCASNQMQMMDYAGYYGAVSDDVIKCFFGSYLPVYSLEPVVAENRRIQKKVCVADDRLLTQEGPVCYESTADSVSFKIESMEPMDNSYQNPILKGNNFRMTLRSLMKNSRKKESTVNVERLSSNTTITEFKAEKPEAEDDEADSADEIAILPDMPLLEI